MADLRVGDIAVMRKPHACGGLEWEITRVGCDIGIKCRMCGRAVMLDRETFLRRARSVTHADASE